MKIFRSNIAIAMLIFLLFTLYGVGHGEEYKYPFGHKTYLEAVEPLEDVFVVETFSVARLPEGIYKRYFKVLVGKKELDEYLKNVYRARVYKLGTIINEMNIYNVFSSWADDIGYFD